MDKIILNYLQHLVTRALASNLLLRFKPQEKGGKRIDVSWLEEQPIFGSDLLQKLIEENTATVNLSPHMVARMSRMKRDADTAYRTFGTHSLFLGWPFVCVRREGSKQIAAPLMFFGIKISLNGSQLTIERFPEMFNYNYMLKAWLKKYKDQSFDESIFSSDEDAPFSNKASLAQVLENFSGELQECHFGISTEQEEIFRLQQYNDDAVPEGSNISVMPFAVFGITRFKYKSMLDDLYALVEKAETGQEMGLLSSFFQNPENINPDIQNLPRVEESDRYLVEESDPSQDQAIAKLQHADVMLIDGPPGSGKSQTIVNLIADALQRKDRKECVVLVCEKITALRVVEKRLEAIGLGHLVLTVTDPSGQRPKIITRMGEVEREAGIGIFSDEEQHLRDSLSASISRFENSCNRISQSRGNETRYSVRGDLLGKIRKLTDKTEFDMGSLQNEEFVQKLKVGLEKTSDYDTDLRQQLEQFVDNYQKSNYPNNKWRQSSVSTETADKINERLASLLPQAEELHEEKQLFLNLLNKDITAILSHSLMRKWTAGFLTSSEKRGAIQRIISLMKGMESTYELAGITGNASFLVDDMFQDNGNVYEAILPYFKDSDHLGRISYINAQKKNNQIIKIFLRHIDSARDPLNSKCQWPDIMMAVSYLIKKESLPSATPARSERLVLDMKEALEKKRELDIEKTCSLYFSRGSEVNVMRRRGLMRQRSSRRWKHTTIRDMLTQGRSSFQKIFPILLTTPDVISQVFPLESGILDTVIVDEASQMFVAEALPIIYRAKKLVVSGDKMQMPPSADFQLQDNEYDDDNGEDILQQEENEQHFVEGFELLEVMENVIPVDSPFRGLLNTHYRSRSAELFNFSNHAFYNGRMQIPPDNSDIDPLLDRPIKVLHVPGTFENSVNRQEIARIISLLRQIWEANPMLSVGVVVSNKTQKSVLEDALYRESERDEDFRLMWGTAREQEDDGEDVSFFVRSIEQVQGDERDVIIFGTTYGDQSRNFGFLGRRERGRRMLNVAITRAKKGMYVVSSLNINNVSNEGEHPGTEKSSERWYLWKFLQYARAVSDGDDEQVAEILRSLNGDGVIPVSMASPDSQFEVDVAEYINALGGYEAVYQVGVSGFKIDIGVKIAGESRYLCGIECDGRYFHEGWHARHNDIWRQGILEGKGWDIYRIWSDHWYRRSAAPEHHEHKKLREYLEQLRQ